MSFSREITPLRGDRSDGRRRASPRRRCRAGWPRLREAHRVCVDSPSPGAHARRARDPQLAIPGDIKARSEPARGVGDALGPAAPALRSLLRAATATMARALDRSRRIHQHGADLGEDFYPKPPDMRADATQRLTDGEIFYIIENGVRFTGMPALNRPNHERARSRGIRSTCTSANGSSSAAQDIRYGFRDLRRSPTATAVALITLAIGIGVNATVFTVTNAVLFKGFAGVHGTIVSSTSATAAAASPMPISRTIERRRNRSRRWRSSTASASSTATRAALPSG